MSDSPAQIAHEAADELFEQHGDAFGDDLARYRHHVHRVLGLIDAQVEIPPDAARPLGVAAFNHDAAIWLDGTWDYLEPSIERALGDLRPEEQEQRELVAALIGEHHRVRQAQHPDPLVEAFRCADRTDVYAGLVSSPGVPRSRYRELVSEYPSLGFRRMLAKAFLRGLRENPLRPMPMVKL